MCIRDRYQRRVHGIQKMKLISTHTITPAKAAEGIRRTIRKAERARKKNHSNYKLDMDTRCKLDLVLKEIEELSEIHDVILKQYNNCLLYTSPSPRDLSTSRMPSSA
eukprot:TRINITY_DN8851_c0_g1_i1.p2 TRINITY_DN8851_c0_g1~~TRINITY_DN8851_c0_g1_i1.p2  ORF type:complete len:107 (+),score=31.06 TRINITY_DN8851_c0_g1_i1:184-504(+)